jgi:cation diffusion facilitator family transporter
MHDQTLHRWQHHHTFGTDERKGAERRTWWVIGLTATMMTVEIAAGMIFGSMALLADGWHMGTHAAALGITVFAYVYARRHADNPRYSFGTGKVGALGGFASAVGLAVVAILVFGESVVRVASPVAIRFDEAIAIAVVGLVVNLASAFILRDHHAHGHEAGEHDDHPPGEPPRSPTNRWGFLVSQKPRSATPGASARLAQRWRPPARSRERHRRSRRLRAEIIRPPLGPPIALSLTRSGRERPRGV